MKIFLFVFLLLSSLNASYLFDKNYPICIEDYYVRSGKLYYLRSSDNKWKSTTTNKLVQYIYPDYEYYNNECLPIPDKKLKDISYLISGFLVVIVLVWSLI